jgi:succinate dehydrogenase/fumarate reductase flavoprotein subunit|tara:strand:+ start:425 stop:805 length:381 start_codon:yes stop_codon:yes gene_type:complete
MPTVIKPKRSEVASSIPSAGSLSVGEIAMNVTDGKFYTKTSGNVVKEMGGAGSITLQNVVTNGATVGNDITLDGANLIFEGYQANAYETTLTVAEPTQDRTVTLPDATGVVALDGDALAYSIVFGG